LGLKEEVHMDSDIQTVPKWARRGNLKQFYTDMASRLGPLGYRAELDMDRIRCYRVTVEKGFMGLRSREVKEEVAVIKRQNGSIDFVEAQDAFVQVLASIAPVS